MSGLYFKRGSKQPIVGSRWNVNLLNSNNSLQKLDATPATSTQSSSNVSNFEPNGSKNEDISVNSNNKSEISSSSSSNVGLSKKVGCDSVKNIVKNIQSRNIVKINSKFSKPNEVPKELGNLLTAPLEITTSHKRLEANKSNNSVISKTETNDAIVIEKLSINNPVKQLKDAEDTEEIYKSNKSKKLPKTESSDLFDDDELDLSSLKRCRKKVKNISDSSEEELEDSSCENKPIKSNEIKAININTLSESKPLKKNKLKKSLNTKPTTKTKKEVLNNKDNKRKHSFEEPKKKIFKGENLNTENDPLKTEFKTTEINSLHNKTTNCNLKRFNERKQSKFLNNSEKSKNISLLGKLSLKKTKSTIETDLSDDDDDLDLLSTSKSFSGISTHSQANDFDATEATNSEELQELNTDGQ